MKTDCLLSVHGIKLHDCGPKLGLKAKTINLTTNPFPKTQINSTISKKKEVSKTHK